MGRASGSRVSRLGAWIGAIGLASLAAAALSCAGRTIPVTVTPATPVAPVAAQSPERPSAPPQPAAGASQPQATPLTEIAPREVLVRFAPGFSDADISREITRLQAEVLRALPALRLYRLRIPANQTVADFLGAQRDNPALQRIEPNPLVRAFQAPQPPNDPYFDSQWGLKRIGIPAAWEVTMGRPDIVVAVIDTGVDASHPDLQGQLVPGTNVLDRAQPPDDEHGHGTAMAGIIAAATGNGVGIAGVCPGCRVMPVKALDATGVGTYADVIEGIVYAADHGARVVNLSVGGSVYSDALRDAVDYARNAGLVVVAAVGNDGTDAVLYPAAYPGVLGVSAVDQEDKTWPLSNRGAEVALAAPGVGIRTTALGGTYRAVTGTSPAAAFVSGLSALLASRTSGPSAEAIIRTLEGTASDLGAPGSDTTYGFGVPNVAQAWQEPSGTLHKIAISQIEIPTASFRPGDRVPVTVAVRNLGESIQRSLSVAVEVNGRAPGPPVMISELAPGATRELTSEWMADAASHGLAIRVTVYGTAADGSAINEMATRQFGVGVEQGQVTVQYKANSHRWITWEAKTALAHLGPNSPVAREIAKYIGDPLLTVQDCSVLADSGSTIIEGALEEDDGASLGDWCLREWRYMRHFWDPNDDYFTGLTSGGILYPSAVDRAHQFWYGSARVAYRSNPATGYWWLGRIAHLLEDMALPAHVNLDPHPFSDDYEDWVKDNTPASGRYPFVVWDYATANMNAVDNWADGRRYETTQNTDLMKLFLSLAEQGDDYESNDRDGELHSRYHSCPYWNQLCGVTDEESAVHREVLLPKAVSHVAGLFRLFYDQTHEQESLGNGIAEDGLISSDEGHFYRITVPSGASQLTVTASTDSDMSVKLYLRNGGMPSDLEWRCIEEGMNTVCAEPTPAAGDWLIGIVGGDGGAIYSLTATVEFPGPPPPSIKTPSLLPSGTVGVVYNKPLEATGGTAPYRWTFVSGMLPPRIEFNAGTLSGTPTTLGTFHFRIRVTGGDELSWDKDFTLTIGVGQTSTATAAAGVSVAFRGEKQASVGAGASVSFPGKDTSTASGGASVAFYGSLDQATGTGVTVAFQGSQDQVAGSGVTVAFQGSQNSVAGTGVSVAFREGDARYAERAVVIGFSDPLPAAALLGQRPQSAYNADPVNTATGNYVYDHTELVVPGRGPGLAFARFYNSLDSTSGPLGFGWTHSYNINVSEDPITKVVSVRWGDGHVDTYDLVSGVYQSRFAGVYDKLTTQAGGTYRVVQKDQRTLSFAASGRLTSIADRNGNTVTLLYDGAARLSSVTDPAGRTLSLTYDSSGRIISVVDPLPRTIGYTYDEAGNLASVIDASGGTTSFTYDANHQLLTATDPRNNVFLTNVYDEEKRVVTWQSDAKGNRYQFSYNAAAGETTITDPLGKTSIDFHDVQARLIRQQDRLGFSVSYSYDDQNNRTSVTDKNGRTTVYTYDANGNVTGKADPLFQTTAITYDTLNNPLSRTDEAGNVTQFEYDAKGNLLAAVDTLAGRTAFTYDAAGQPLTAKDTNGGVTTNTYDAAGNLLSTTDSAGKVTTMAYDAVGRRVSATDARGHTTTFAYDGHSNLLSTTDALNHAVTHQYDGNSNRVKTTDAKGNITRFAYDANNLLTTVTDAADGVVTNTYNELDRKTAVRDARGNTTTFEYDSEGRQTAAVDPSGNVTRFAYDGQGNRVSMTDPKSAVWTYTYDALNRQIKARDPLGNESSTAYDELGQVVGTTDALGRKTSFTYDALGRLLQVKDAAGGTAKYTYDKVGNRLTVTDPNTQTTTLTYDALNRPLTSIDPLGHAYTYTYDAAGNRTRVVDANGAVVNYECDVVNRLTAIQYPDSTGVTFTYDANGNLTQMVDAVGTTTYIYDGLNRTTGYIDAYGKAIGYEYDAVGNRTALVYPDGKRVAYTFDANNRMATVTDWGSRVTRYTYDERGLLTLAENANGTMARYTYDSATRLLTLVNTKADASVISSHAFTLDKTGNRKAADEVLPLASAPAPVVTPYTYDQANQIQTAGPVTFTFDNNGNMTTKTEPAGTTTFTWDFANRLKQLTGPGTSAQYVYNGAGTRLSRTLGGATTRYAIDPVASLSQLLIETDAASNPIGYYVYGLGLISKVIPAGAVYQYHFNPIGSTVAMTDASQAVVNTYAYCPFGEVSRGTEAVANAFTFDGRDGVLDDGNGLLFARARYYAPELGRFLTRDPMPNATTMTQGVDGFAYGLNNPLLLLDPRGELPTWASLSLGVAKYFARTVVTEAVRRAVSEVESAVTGAVHAAGQYIVSGSQVFYIEGGGNGSWVLRDVMDVKDAIGGAVKNFLAGTIVSKTLDLIEGVRQNAPTPLFIGTVVFSVAVGVGVAVAGASLAAAGGVAAIVGIVGTELLKAQSAGEAGPGYVGGGGGGGGSWPSARVHGAVLLPEAREVARPTSTINKKHKGDTSSW